MTKSQLAAIVAKRAHLTKRAAEETIDATLEEIARALKKGDKIVLSGFGTFYLGEMRDKQVVPFGKTANRQTIKKHHIVHFRAGKPMKKMVW
jgi:DNA-binding protein HU-beta